MANDSETKRVDEPAAAPQAVSPRQQSADETFTDVSVSLKRQEPLTKNALEGEKYHRAKMHMGSIGDVKSSDAFKAYKRNWLASFFGANEPEPFISEGPKVHPCKLFANEVHRCLEQNNNDFLLCQTRVANFQLCLREFNM